MSGDTTIVGGARRARPGPLRLSRGDEIGRYVLLDQLGRGGMGVVFSAFDPTLDRKVALKVLHCDPEAAEDSSGQPRLLREAQALAKLSHPNVITVHDVGTHEGAVFIAMEFIAGQTLSQWCETPRPWSELVRMLIAAGRGIAAAHRANMIHRDFKPENVMIGQDGRPRVLDFGLARAAYEGSGVVAIPVESAELGSSSTFDAKLTETGALMGTPAYMAPEQFAGGRVDERSDQFSFCVSAYEALYGERPFAGESLAAIAFQVSQGNIREAPRTTQVPSWLRKVVVRGLAVEPEQRWPSMDALLEALARDPLRRRRRVCLALVLVTATAGLGALAQRGLAKRQAPCSGAADHLVGVWDDEARAAMDSSFDATGLDYAGDAARGVAAVLDGYASAWTQMHTEACEATRVRGEQSDEVLSLRMACLGRSLDQLGALVEVVRDADAEVVERALEASTSLPPLAACADVEALLVGVKLPESEAERTQVEALRARLDEARSLDLAGKRGPAIAHFEAMGEAVTALGYRPLVAEFNRAYAQTLEAAELKVELLEQGVWMAEASHHDREAALLWLDLIGAYVYQSNDFDRARWAIERGAAAIARLGGDPNLEIRLENAQGKMLSQEGRDEEALVVLEKALAMRRALGDSNSPEIGRELLSRANVLMNLGRYDESEPLLLDALARDRATFGEGHPRVGRIHGTLGRVYYGQSDYERAEVALEAALDLFERSYGPRSREYSSILNGLALVREGAGKIEEAKQTYERALELSVELYGPRHLHSAKIQSNLGNLEARLGNYERGVELLELALEVRRERLGQTSVGVGYVLDDLGSMLRRQGQLDRAELEYARSLAVFDALDDPVRRGFPLRGLGQLALARGDAAEARTLLEEARTLLAQDPALAGVAARGSVAFGLARALAELGERERARAMAEEALATFESDAGVHAEDIEEVRSWLAAN